MDNVYPSLTAPFPSEVSEKGPVSFADIKCLEMKEKPRGGDPVKLTGCESAKSKEQLMYLMRDGSLTAQSYPGLTLCLEKVDGGWTTSATVKWEPCDRKSPNQRLEYDATKKQLRFKAFEDKCLGAYQRQTNK